MKRSFSDIAKMLAEETFLNNETQTLHTPYVEEKALLECIKDGDLERLEETYALIPDTIYGQMSSSLDPLKQLFYGCISNTTLVTRYAIEGGLDEEIAFNLSDVYIRKMERCTTLEELNETNEMMAIDFTSRVAKSKAVSTNEYSSAIQKTIKIINSRTHQKILLSELAHEVGLNTKYLSALFKKETGQNISDFILDTRIKEAKRLLKYTDFTSIQISEALAFHSQSYFIQCFKKITGETPNEYRANH